MPIYEYECESCGRVVEALQKFSEAPLETCTHCSGKLHKLISHSAFHLKGSGWYVTDYANKSGQNTETPSKTTSKDTGEPKESKSEPSKSVGKKTTPE